MLTNILIAMAVFVILFVIFVSLRPADFRYTRKGTISATPAEVFAHVNDFHNWEAWSPWAKLDPNATATFEGPSSGEGAKFHWAGNKEVGEGNMTIIESRPNDVIRIRLEFLKPFRATNMSEFTFEPRGSQTEVTWSMYGKNNFMAKLVGLFMDCEKMVGPQFEQGLANMKRVAEEGTPVTS